MTSSGKFSQGNSYKLGERLWDVQVRVDCRLSEINNYVIDLHNNVLINNLLEWSITWRAIDVWNSIPYWTGCWSVCRWMYVVCGPLGDYTLLVTVFPVLYDDRRIFHQWWTWNPGASLKIGPGMYLVKLDLFW